MGYDVHITRKANWSDRDGPRIAIEEWKAIIDGDPELRLDGAAEIRLEDGSMFRMESPGLAVWTTYSGHGVEGNMAWIDLRNGNLVVKNPDQEILRKLWQIAATLKARIQGDEGEIYDATGNIDRQRPWWKLW